MARRNLRGLEHAQRVFRGVPREFQERIVHALNRGAEEVAQTASILAPHDPETEIDLRDQIETVIATRKNARPSQVEPTASPNSVAAYVIAGDTPERFYAALKQEFGRPAGPSGHPGHAPQPFMFPAFWSLRRRVLGRVRREVKRAAKAMAMRGGGGGN